MIKDKVVVISGASSGIGAAIAKHLAHFGAIVFLGARRLNKLTEVAEEINKNQGRAFTHVLDVTSLASWQRFKEFIFEKVDHVDVLVSNAGVMPLSRLELGHVKDWDNMIDVNIKGFLYGINCFLTEMTKRKSGHFINIASVAGHRVPLNNGSSVYSATKFAVRAISEGLRQEMTPYGIRTTIISPGAVQSELTHRINDPEVKKNIPLLLNIAISPNHIAKAVAYAIDQEEDCDVNEILIRPTAQLS